MKASAILWTWLKINFNCSISRRGYNQSDLGPTMYANMGAPHGRVPSSVWKDKKATKCTMSHDEDTRSDRP